MLKRVITTLIITSLLALGTSAWFGRDSHVQAQATNLIPNPSVETAEGNTPQAWLTGNWGTNATQFSYLNTGYTGNRSLKVEMTQHTDGDAKWYFTPQPVAAGQDYIFSDFYQSNT